VWLDFIRRRLITSGELQHLVDEDGLGGVTSNPAIFEKAIASSDDYASAIARLAALTDFDDRAIFEELAIADVQAAADVLYPVYQQTRYRDGYVSLEVSPYLAYDTAGTIDEARRLWRRLNRQNVMIKVPATPEGIAAIRELVGEGLNINVTLLFSIEAYERVATAYILGLEQFARRGGRLAQVASVASFFVSRIDSAIDPHVPASLRGTVAIANARLAYDRYGQMFSSARWRDLALNGAQTQRLLWASTSTKSAAYRDVVYVEQLIGADTVNTIPPATFAAFRDHGEPASRLADDLDGAQRTMRALSEAGISMGAITERLLEEGVQLFATAFDALLAAIARQREVTTCNWE
jgi:transaldolase/glucose-6-phosphate isomerase